ncbi:MAG: hypothetical protein JSS96_03075 [Bacteroidetes bacterium]|nr:hypothetical protein [Bacteroidota bacterium]
MSQKNTASLVLGTDNYSEITERWIAADIPSIPKKHHKNKKREHTLLRILKLIIKS